MRTTPPLAISIDKANRFSLTSKTPRKTLRRLLVLNRLRLINGPRPPPTRPPRCSLEGKASNTRWILRDWPSCTVPNYQSEIVFSPPIIYPQTLNRSLSRRPSQCQETPKPSWRDGRCYLRTFQFRNSSFSDSSRRTFQHGSRRPQAAAPLFPTAPSSVPVATCDYYCYSYCLALGHRCGKP